MVPFEQKETVNISLNKFIKQLGKIEKQTFKSNKKRNSSTMQEDINLISPISIVNNYGGMKTQKKPIVSKTRKPSKMDKYLDSVQNQL